MASISPVQRLDILEALENSMGDFSDIADGIFNGRRDFNE